MLFIHDPVHDSILDKSESLEYHSLSDEFIANIRITQLDFHCFHLLR